MHRGYIKFWRCALNDKFFSLHPNTITLFLCLLLKAQHQPLEIVWNNEKMILNPGEILITENQLESMCKRLSRQNIRTSLKILEKLNFLTKNLTKNNQAGTIIKITNWGKYQNGTNQEPNHELTMNQPRTNHELTINNNIEEYKNDKNVEKTTLAESEKKTSLPAVEKIRFENCEFLGIADKYKNLWKKAYTAIDLDIEIAKAASWLVANPKNKKSNYNRFLTNWFSRAQDRAKRNNTSEQSNQPTLEERIKAEVNKKQEEYDQQHPMQSWERRNYKDRQNKVKEAILQKAEHEGIGVWEYIGKHPEEDFINV